MNLTGFHICLAEYTVHNLSSVASLKLWGPKRLVLGE